jgi:hypothetical protein
VKTVEEIIKWLEYAISFSKWGINSLRDFPPFPKKGQDGGNSVSGNSAGTN